MFDCTPNLKGTSDAISRRVGVPFGNETVRELKLSEFRVELGETLCKIGREEAIN